MQNIKIDWWNSLSISERNTVMQEQKTVVHSVMGKRNYSTKKLITSLYDKIHADVSKNLSNKQ